MKILFVSSWYPPVVSGSSLWTESLVGALRKRGHEVRVVTTQWPGGPREPAGSRPEKVYYLPAWLLRNIPFFLGLPIIPIAFSPANRRRLVEIVEEFKPDIIHQMNHIFDSIFLSAYAARKTGTPLVGSITTPVQSTRLINYALMHLVDLALVYTFGVRHWQRIICADAEIARYALETYRWWARDRVVTGMHVGVHERIQHGEATERAPWPQLALVGHTHAIRDPTNIIRAMPAILKRFPNARLDIAGRVQFSRPVDEVKRLGLESSVRFLGQIPPEEVSKLISRAQVFTILHQMKFVSISMTSFEAMYFETPVVTNAPNDLYGSGVIRDGENIMLVDRDNVDEIAQKIIRLLEDEELRRSMGQNARQFVSSHLTWDICAEKTEKLYEEILAAQLAENVSLPDHRPVIADKIEP
ncbi:MAG: glycosyltransferase family 4 protein [Chloroflexi bacterium]|nr:glycosyltransferase family 4 protein [Chloroflexota bacterium]